MLQVLLWLDYVNVVQLQKLTARDIAIEKFMAAFSSDCYMMFLKYVFRGYNNINDLAVIGGSYI